MNTRFCLLVALTVVMAIFLSGCSHSSQGDAILPSNFPTSPDSGQSTPLINLPATAPGHHLAGIFDLKIDLNAGEIKAVPLRETEIHFNVTDMLLPPNCYDCLGIVVKDIDFTARCIKVEVSLKNPTDILIYDVRGIFMTNQPGWELKDCRAYTTLYDDGPPIIVNPYIQFGNNHYEFPPGDVYSEEYLIAYPENPDFNGLKYAIDVSWPGYCEEPYSFSIKGPAVMLPQGGDYTFTASVSDHQKDVLTVIIDATPIGVGVLELLPFPNNPGGISWKADIHFPGVEAGVSPGKYMLMGWAFSEKTDLAAIRYVTINVSPIDQALDVTPPFLNLAPEYIVSNGAFVFAGGEHRINAYDVTVPDNPKCLCTLDLRPYGIESMGMQVDGNIMLVDGTMNDTPMTLHTNKLAIVDITDPANMKINWTTDLPNNKGGYSMHLSNGYVILVCRGGDAYAPAIEDIRVYSVDPPSQTHLLSETPLPQDFRAGYSILNDGFLFLGNDERLVIFRLSPTFELELIYDALLENPPIRSKPAINGDYAYTIHYKEVRVYNINPPEETHCISVIGFETTPKKIYEHNGFLYASFGDPDFGPTYTIPIDISNPEEPLVLDQTPGCAGIVWGIKDNMVYCSEENFMEIQVLDLSIPTAPVVHPIENAYSLGAYNGNQKCTFFGNRFLIPIRDLGIISYNISDAPDVYIADEFWTIARPMAVAIRESAGYVLEYFGYLKVVNLSSASRARVVNVVPEQPSEGDFRGSSGLAFYGDYLVVSNDATSGSDFLEFYDISDPFNPQFVAEHQGGYNGRLVIEGNRAARLHSDIYPAKINSPMDVEFMEKITGQFRSLSLKDGLLFAIRTKPGNVGGMLKIFNPYDNPPKGLLNTVDLPGDYANSLALSGDFAYFGDPLTGIDIVKINPWEDAGLIGTDNFGHMNKLLFSRGALIIGIGGDDYSLDGWELMYHDPEGGLHPVSFHEITCGDIEDGAILNGHVYICDFDGGLYIYELWHE